MRKDLHKIIVEDPRRGGEKFSWHRNCKNNAVFDEEAVGGKESMMSFRRRAFGSRKSFGDHLSPVRGMLQKNVGRKWNDVYSELCAQFDKRGTMNNHIFEHIKRDFLIGNVKLDADGEPCALTSWDGWKPVAKFASSSRQFYVHPETGILCSVEKPFSYKAYRRRRAEEYARSVAEMFLEVSATEHLYKEGGIWYVYTVSTKMAPVLVYHRPPEIAQHEWITMTEQKQQKVGIAAWQYEPIHEVRPETNFLRTGGSYYSSRHTAGKKVLRKHGLKNDPPKEKAMSHRQANKYV